MIPRRFRAVRRASCLAASLLLAAACQTTEIPEVQRERPNFLVIVADDLGYSDLGAYGSEIDTPNLDALAHSGLMATEFYVAPDGGPTRAMLLTGVDHHTAGIGDVRRWKRDPLGEVGYSERLSDGVVTVASLLQRAGYHTYMAGRWELGQSPERRPEARGFERSFVLHDGAASYWSDMSSAIPGRDRAFYTRDGVPVEELPEDYYSTAYFTDFVLESIEEQRGDGRPFLAYLSYQAPHGPLAVPDDWRDRYKGRYDQGYDAVRDARIMRMKTDGLVEQYVRPYPGLPTIPAWGDLPEAVQKTQSRKMELYAAMVSNLDFHVGRLIEHLREVGELHETVIVFLSDNGAEAADRGALGMDPRDRTFYVEQFPTFDPEAWGGPGTFLEYGPAWAQVSTAPFRLFKGTLAEGGIRSPLIVAGPGVKTTRGLTGIRKRPPTDALLSVMDLTPTFLDMAGVPHPTDWDGRAVARLQGGSLVPLLAGEFNARHGPHEWLGFELGGEKAVRRGDYKAVLLPKPFGTGDWRLYKLELDPAELYDVSESRAGEKAELLSLWEEYAQANGIGIGDADSDEAGADSDEATTESGEATAQNPSPSDM